MKLPIFIVNSSGDGVTGLTFATSDIVTAIDGGAYDESTGTSDEIGYGLYFYEAADADISGSSLRVLAEKSPHVPFELATPIPVLIEFRAGTTGDERFIPLRLVDASNEGIDDADPDPDADDLLVSIDGAEPIAATGTWINIGSGGYWYDPSEAERETPGMFALIVRGVGDGVTPLPKPLVVVCYIGDPVPVVPEPPTPIAVPITYGDPEYVDHVQLAIDRLPQQFKPRIP